MAVLLLGLSLLALVGHAAFWIRLLNHLHALAWPRPLIKSLSLGIDVCLAAGPVALAVWIIRHDAAGVPWPTDLPLPALAYFVAAAAFGLVVLPGWWRRRFHPVHPPVLVSNHTAAVDLRRELGNQLPLRGLGGWVLRIPGNQVLELEINDKTLQIPRLDPHLAGLSIVHLSDLHFSGKVDKAYFQEVVRRANQLQPDLVAITGDLVDKTRCLDWIADTLARLESRHGVYFVLGNHDRRVDAEQLRRLLAEAGLVDLSERPRLLEINGRPVLLAGNELPWFRRAVELADAPTHHGAHRVLRVLLAHTPDQLRWARRREVDLMLAGHTHGGQVCLPLVGPLVAPSHAGVKYCSGTFYEPPTVLHVSRGVSSLQLVRWNCRPELARLVLIPAAEHQSR